MGTQHQWLPNDGELYHNSCKAPYSDRVKRLGKDFAQIFIIWDVVDVGVNYLKQEVFFTKNNFVVGSIIICQTPCIPPLSLGAKV